MNQNPTQVVDEKLQFCEGLLRFAIRTESEDIIRKLVTHYEIEVNFEGESGSENIIVYQLAAEYNNDWGHLEIIKLLVEQGVNIDCVFECRGREETLLTRACMYSNEEIIMYLLTIGANPDQSLNKNYGPLCIATLKKRSDIVKLLLEWGASFNMGLALCMSAFTGNMETVKTLLNYGADPKACSLDISSTTVYEAAARGHCEVVELFLNLGAEINATTNAGLSALHVAFLSGTKKVVQLLIDRGADVNYTNSLTKERIIHYAARRTDDDCSFVKLALSFGVEINEVDSRGETALIKSVERKHENIVKFLLSAGADVNTEDNRGSSALTGAIARDRENLIIAKIIVKRIAQLKAKQMFVSVNNLLAIEENLILSAFLLECEKEIENLKKEHFDDSPLTMYNVLCATNAIQFMGFARNENIARVLGCDDFKLKFPLYGETIIVRYEAGKLRNHLFEKFKRFFNFLATRKENKLFKLPLICLSHIFSFIDKDDASNLPNCISCV